MPWVGPRTVNIANVGIAGAAAPPLIAANEVTVKDFYVEAGTVGIILDAFHTSSGAATVLWKIKAMPYTAGAAGWATTTPVIMLQSTALAKDTNLRMVVDPRVTAVANTHASTALPYIVRITCEVETAELTGLYASVTQVV